MQCIATGRGGFGSGVIYYHYECQKCWDMVHKPIPDYIPERQIERYLIAKR